MPQRLLTCSHHVKILHNFYDDHCSFCLQRQALAGIRLVAVVDLHRSEGVAVEKQLAGAEVVPVHAAGGARQGAGRALCRVGRVKGDAVFRLRVSAPRVTEETGGETGRTGSGTPGSSSGWRLERLHADAARAAATRQTQPRKRCK